METYNFEEFKQQFEIYDTEKIWEDNEIELLYNELMCVYGEITSENFDIIYCIKNKECINF